MALTPRGKALRHLKKHRETDEQPHGSNTDRRPTREDGRPGKRGIREAQHRCAGGSTWLVGTAWCGEWARWALERAGVQNLSYRQASVALIEDDARAGRGPFFDWRSPSEWRHVLRGDLVVLFGRGVHVETVRSFKRVSGTVVVVTEGGNTSSGTGGDQSNGGGAYRRERPLRDVYGFARVNYPGGRTVRVLDQVSMVFSRAARAIPPAGDAQPSSDRLLLERLQGQQDPDAAELVNAMNMGRR